ncbi:MAG: hypothetical protein AAF827_15445 [Cyanobacteria bacterium P01_D01_bin.6]
MVAKPEEFIPINGALSLKPSLGPIPADQVFPWACIVLGNLFVVKSLLGLSWIVTILSIGWSIATWWILTGSDTGKFLSKFHAPPFWMYGCAQYASPLTVPELPATGQGPRQRQRGEKGKRRRKDRWRRRRIQS